MLQQDNNKKLPIRVEYLIRSIGGGFINVYVRDENNVPFVVRNVPENLVRCALGHDTEYLLTTQNKESSFHITANELFDFIKGADRCNLRGPLGLT